MTCHESRKSLQSKVRVMSTISGWLPIRMCEPQGPIRPGARTLLQAKGLVVKQDDFDEAGVHTPAPI